MKPNITHLPIISFPYVILLANNDSLHVISVTVLLSVIHSQVHVVITESAHTLFYLLCLIPEIVYYYLSNVLLVILFFITKIYLTLSLVSYPSIQSSVNQFYVWFIFSWRALFLCQPWSVAWVSFYVLPKYPLRPSVFGSYTCQNDSQKLSWLIWPYLFSDHPSQTCNHLTTLSNHQFKYRTTFVIL